MAEHSSTHERANSGVDQGACVTPAAIRRLILEQSKRANVGHIGSCLCVVEILTALYSRVLRGSSPTDPERDRFILSKGHSGLALYAALVLRGWLPEQELSSFCGDSSKLAVHPDFATSGVDFSTGSLGHGLSMAAGVALAARLQRSARRVFCLMSDAECNEGSVWEAAMFAAHHGLHSLTAIVDVNGQQAMGLTKEVLDSTNLKERWAAFGWRAVRVDGHSVADLVAILNDPHPGNAPRIVLAQTVFGKGVSFMERGVSFSQPHIRQQPINWHYLPMSDEEFRTAMAEIGDDQ